MFTTASRTVFVSDLRWAAVGLVLAAFGLVGHSVAAQQGAEPPSVVPPTLVDAPAPHFPESAIAAGVVEASVVLRVTIDPEGQVSAAELVEPAGHGFDLAAQQVALEYRFEPARRDGEAVAARILLRVEFRRPSPPAEASPAAEAQPVPLVPASASAPTTAAAVEVNVRGHSEAERLRRSAEAVHVVETAEAKRRTSDLGEVLARTQGVGVQRVGGVGSETRFSLNGLTDDQVRFFLDGVPLEFAGYPFGIANIPINLVERVEIYRGVVPIRFGADALGGAVNVVGDRKIRGTHASASVQAGSFGTYLTTLSAQHLDERSGWFTRVNGFIDRADNDYPMDVQVPDAVGRERPARVYRFHDAYRAEGANLETGLVEKPWAKRLLLRGFVTHYDQEIQHNLLMTHPYGDITLGELSTGATVRYENTFGERVFVGVVAGYTYGQTRYTDVGECTYDWFGQCVRPRPQPGERNGRAEDQLYAGHGAYGRVNVDLTLHPKHVIRVSLSPTYTSQTGDEQHQANPDARDPLSAQRQLFSFVAGVEHNSDLLEDRLENVLFFKDYLQVLRSEDPLSSGKFRRRDRETHRLGLGDSLRYAFAPWIYAKASYEWATRLPTADEIFGDAFPVKPNLELEPELSHNINLGISVDATLARAGRLRADINGFVRDADQLIVLVGDDQSSTYQNVYSARSVGVETAFGWSSPGEYISLDGNVTYVDFRNTSSTGAFARSEGERIPNRPYLFGNGQARFQLRRVAASRDELALIWATRYVHAFFRGWEGLGTDKLTVDAQLLHALALTYAIESDPVSLSFTGEVQNLTDQPAFDFYGVPRPGRAFFFKATASL
jgi:vitamin B12 transporter